MASSGSFTTSSCENRSLTFSWSVQSQSIANNTTTITWSLKGSGSYTGWVACGGFQVKINGTTVCNQSTDYRINVWQGTTVASGTHTISHNGDGTKTFSAEAKAGIYTFAVNCSGSGSWTLPTIARASSISSVTSSVAINGSNKVTVNISRKNTNFTHTVKFYINSSYTKTVSSVGTSTSYAIPTSWLSAMPSSTSCTAYCEVTTYNGSTKIGDTVKKSFTVTVPDDVKPTVGSITFDPVDINSQNILIQGKNKLTVKISGCSGGTGSGIKSYTFSGPGIPSTTTTSTSVTSSGTISNTGTLTYTVTVTDNRGRSTKTSNTITCYDYATPTVQLTAKRKSNNSQQIQYNYTVTYSSVNNTNNLTVKLFYKKSTDSSYTSQTMASSFTQTSGGGTISSLDADASYEIYVQVTDKYGSTAKSVIKTIYGAERIFNIPSHGKGISFGKMSTSTSTDPIFESKWPIKSDGNFVVQTNNNGYWITNKDGTRSAAIYKNSDNLWIGSTSANGTHITGGTLISAGDFKNGIGVSKIHSDNSRATAWVLDTENYGRQLYNNTSGNAGTVTITLTNQTIDDFKYLEIFYVDNIGRGHGSVKVYSPNNAYLDLSLIEAADNYSLRTYIRRTAYQITGSGNSILITPLKCSNESDPNKGHINSGYALITGNETSTWVDSDPNTNYIKITRVTGYKKFT